MLWESDSVRNENRDEMGSGSDENPIYPNVTPVLLPPQSGTNNSPKERVPVVVPDVEELKEQFQLQQNMLTQIKKSIKENESELNSKGKKVQAYANRLAQIRARTKKNDNKVSIVPRKPASSPVKTLTKKPSKENLAKENDSALKNKSAQSNVKLSPKAKCNELKKKLQESKIKFEERTGKEVSETKRIESIVENLKMQLQERDITIKEVQKIAENPALQSVKLDTSLRKNKKKTDGKPITSKSTQTASFAPNGESSEIMALQNRIYELEESLKEKESVIDARTQAVTLVSQDLSIKEKNTMECLEETRHEMRSLQSNFIIIENQLKKELVEKDDILISTEEKLKKYESVNSELNAKNAELLGKLIDLEKKYIELESDKSFLRESIIEVKNDDKLAELNNEIRMLNKELDGSNKSMIKMKLEHKNKIKNLNRIIDKLRQASDDKAEIVRLQTRVDDFEVVTQTLQNKIAELEEEKVVENKLKGIISELKAQIKEQAVVIEDHLQTVSNIEKEKFDMSQSVQDQNILIENLYAKIENLESEISEKDLRTKELQDELQIKMESLKLDNSKIVEAPMGDKNELEECKITKELKNVQVEEQIEMLIREKQQLLDKLKSLSGVSATESFTFETVEHSDFEGQTESKPYYTDAAISCMVEDVVSSDDARNQDLRLQRIIDEQQTTINDLQCEIINEKEKTLEYQRKLEKLEEDFKNLEHGNNQLKPEPTDESEASKTSKPNVTVKYKIKKIQTELVESRKTIQLQNEKLEELNMKLAEKEQLIKDYIEKIELFEKDDWGRENDWKATQDEFENMRELQKKCLSLENSLIELTEDCERLRKENIEVVHLLSEEKVKRKKLMEKLQVEDYGSLTSVELNEPRPDLLEESSDIFAKEGSFLNVLEERVLNLIEAEESLENRLKVLEVEQNHQFEVSRSEKMKHFESTIRDLQEKLEWFNIVLTSKETEIFKLQSSFEDSAKTIEDLQRDFKEATEKLTEKTGKYNEIQVEIESKNKQLGELTVNNTNLQERIKTENERTMLLEAQLTCLKQTIKDLEIDGDRKEKAFMEIQGILTEKNLEIDLLKKNLKQLDMDLTSTQEERSAGMGKCIRDEEEKYSELLSQRKDSDDSKQALEAMNEDLRNQVNELNEKEAQIRTQLNEKEKIIAELTTKVNELLQYESYQSIDEIQLKMKKLTTVLKKKVQSEKNLLQQVKEQEESLAEKEKLLEKLLADLGEVNEKWEKEKNEMEKLKIELATVLSAKSETETENTELKEKLIFKESEYNAKLHKSEYKVQQMETQLQKMYQSSEKLRRRQEQDKELITKMESQLTNNSSEIKKDYEEMRIMLGEICGKYEEKKFEVDELCRDKSKVEEILLQVRAEVEQLKSDNACKEAKIQEQLTIIESLEFDLTQTRDHLRGSEEKLSVMEEQRSSLENKTEEMLKRIEEDSKNALLIDDMSNQIQTLAESEQNLKSTVRSLGDKNNELEVEIKELTDDRAALEKELAEFRQKLSNALGELEKLRQLDGEKSTVLELLSAESERLKSITMESKQKSVDMEKLQKDIQLLEADLNENVENSKSIEKLLNHKIEELMQENATLSEKIKDMSETKENEEDNKMVTSKKSVTFRTDETSYIQDLKSQIHEYSEGMKKYEEEIAGLKMELLRERLRNEVAEVISEAKEKVESLKSTPEKAEPKFDANLFFGKDTAPKESQFFDQQVDGLGALNQDQNVDHDSLTWDDGWGTDGHLEEQSPTTQTTAPSQENCDSSEKEAKIIEEDKKKIQEKYQQLQAKYAKVINKMKKQKTACDKLQTEVNRLKSGAKFGGVEGAIMDGLKSEIAAHEQREKELLKCLQSSKAEQEELLQRLDTLNAENEKLVEVKEKQEEIDRWESKNRELVDEIAELRNELSIKEKELSVIKNDVIKDMKHKIQELQWENSGLKDSLVEMIESQNEGENEEGMTEEEEEEEHNDFVDDNWVFDERPEEREKTSGEIIEDLQQQVATLASENDALQEILNDMNKGNGEPVASTSRRARGNEVCNFFKSIPSITPYTIESIYADQLREANIQLEKELQNMWQINGLLRQQLSLAESSVSPINIRRYIRESYNTTYDNPSALYLQEKNNVLQKVCELEQALAIKIEDLNRLSAKMRDLDQLMELKVKELDAVNEDRQELEEALRMKSAESKEYFTRIKELEQALIFKAEDLEKANMTQSELESALQAKGIELNNAIETVKLLEEKLRVREDEGYKILTELAAKVDEINGLSLKTQELEEDCARKSALLENVQKINHELVRNAECNTPGIESLTGLLTAERLTVAELRRSIKKKEDVLRSHSEEIKSLRDKLHETEEKLKEVMQECEKQRTLVEDYCGAKENLEGVVSKQQTELQTVNEELDVTRKNLEELKDAKEKQSENLQAKIAEVAQLESEMMALKEKLHEKTEYYEKEMAEMEAMFDEERVIVRKASRALGSHIETLKIEVTQKEMEIIELNQVLDEEQIQLLEMRALLETKDAIIADSKKALKAFEDEIKGFRDFEKQVKELRLAQIGPDVPVTEEGEPDFTDWTEHELTELNRRLQSDLDAALSFLHYRDTRCNELTIELLQLLEERDTLQLRLSSSIRINEELRVIASNSTATGAACAQQEEGAAAAAAQPSDNSASITKLPEENLQKLAQKISELRSINYIKDKTIQDEAARRHREQMSLLARVSETDTVREPQSSTSSTNKIRTGKSPPRVMHV